MKKSIFLLLFSILLMMATAGSLVADEYYDIRHYDVKIVVDDDNNYHITETIDVEFYSPRHGIYREIPTVVNEQNHLLKKIQVIDPATGDKYGKSVSKSNGVTTIRIGDEDIYVDGMTTYELSYTYMGGMDFDTTMDEFYFNVIGNDWEATIDEVTFEIVMPKSFDVTRLNLTSGPYGSTENLKTEFEVQGRTISGKTIEPLYREYITVALPLEEGYYTGVDPSLNLTGLIIFMGLIIGIAIYAFYKNHELKNKNVIVPVISFNPPKGFNAAEVGYIYGRESFFDSDLSTLILSWASLGCLSIEEKKKKIMGTYMVFTKLKNLPSHLPNYEISLFNDMFRLGSGGVVSTEDLENVFYKSLSEASMSLRSKFTKEKEILDNKVQWLSKLYAFIYILVFSLGFGLIANYLIHTGFMNNFIPIALISLFFYIVIGIVASIFKRAASKKKIVLTTVLAVLLLFIASLIYSVAYSRLIEVLSWQSSSIVLMLYILNLSVVLGIWYMISAKSYTAYAKVALGEIEGFREFLRTAKIDQMEVLHQNNPAYVYDILPFAMTLGLTTIWEKYVNKLSVEAPSWYHSSTRFTPGSMTSSMNKSFSSAASQPSSSGSGGSSSSGGFSGGGGGGGGGGSW